MKVVATQKGYLGCIREPGDVFDVPEGITGSWFNPVPGEPKAADKAPDKPKGTAKKPAQADPGEEDAII